MNKLIQHRSLIRENLAVLVGLCLCFYFSYHALQGNRSMVRLLALNHSVEKMTDDLQSTTDQRIALETRVKAMRPGAVSKDLLEERVRETLGYRHPDEVEINSN
jgi:cell division protein FtsB